MIVGAVEGRVRSVMVTTLGIHRGLTGRLSRSHVVNTLLEVERQLVLMGYLGNDMSRVAR